MEKIIIRVFDPLPPEFRGNPPHRQFGLHRTGMATGGGLSGFFLKLSKGIDALGSWNENGLCESFSTGKALCTISFSSDDRWLFGFLGVGSTPQYYPDKSCMDGLHRVVKLVTREHIGKAFFIKLVDELYRYDRT